MSKTATCSDELATSLWVIVRVLPSADTTRCTVQISLPPLENVDSVVRESIDLVTTLSAEFSPVTGFGLPSSVNTACMSPVAAKGFDALLVGYYDGPSLRFVGKVRVGFVPHARREVLGKTKPLHASECPFVNLPDTHAGRWGAGVAREQMREMQWLKPQLVVQIRFLEWTAEGRLRHASYLGLRSDKQAVDVRREVGS